MKIRGWNFFHVIFLLSVVGACAWFQTKAVPEVAKAVDRYCKETPLALRLEARKLVNTMVQPGTTIVITCPGDPQSNNNAAPAVPEPSAGEVTGFRGNDALAWHANYIFKEPKRMDAKTLFSPENRIQVALKLLTQVSNDIYANNYSAPGRPNITSVKHVLALPASQWAPHADEFIKVLKAPGERAKPPIYQTG